MEILNYKQLQQVGIKVNLQQILERKIQHKSEGFIKVTISDTLLNQIAHDIANILGGRHATKNVVATRIKGPESTFLYHHYFEDIELEKKWNINTLKDLKEFKQELRNYFNRL